jgi:hypothetical protein
MFSPCIGFVLGLGMSSGGTLVAIPERVQSSTPLFKDLVISSYPGMELQPSVVEIFPDPPGLRPPSPIGIPYSLGCELGKAKQVAFSFFHPGDCNGFPSYTIFCLTLVRFGLVLGKP